MAALLAVFGCGEAAPQQATIKLDPQRKFQIITGWEATAQAGENHSPAFELYKDELFDRAVDDLGINRLRLEIRSGAENPEDFFSAFKAKKISEEEFRAHYYEAINDNGDPFFADPKGFQFSELDSTVESVVLPLKKRLAARGEKLFVNLNYVDFSEWRGAANVRHRNEPEEYAEFILAVYRHMKEKYGFVPDAVEVVLEPDNKTGWTGTDIGRAIVAAARRLKADGFEPAFIAPGTTNTANAPDYIDEIARVPGAMQYVTEFSYHRYCCASPPILERIAERAAKFGKRTAMLEWIGADYNTLHEDLKIGRNSAWQQFALAFPNQPDNGAQYFLIDDRQPEKTVLAAGSRTNFLRQYFRYIRAGAQRIGAESTNRNFDPLAFINSNGRYVVVVKADAPGTVGVRNLPPGKYGVSYATAKEYGISLPDVTLASGEALSASIPSSGVMTIFAKDAAAKADE